MKKLFFSTITAILMLCSVFFFACAKTHENEGEDTAETTVTETENNGTTVKSEEEWKKLFDNYKNYVNCTTDVRASIVFQDIDYGTRQELEVSEHAEIDCDMVEGILKMYEDSPEQNIKQYLIVENEQGYVYIFNENKWSKQSVLASKVIYSIETTDIISELPLNEYYEKFAYDDERQCYYNSEPLVININDNNLSSRIEYSIVEIYVKNKAIERINIVYNATTIQTIFDGTTMTQMHVSGTIYNFGTTVIEIPQEVIDSAVSN